MVVVVQCGGRTLTCMTNPPRLNPGASLRLQFKHACFMCFMSIGFSSINLVFWPCAIGIVLSLYTLSHGMRTAFQSILNSQK